MTPEDVLTLAKAGFTAEQITALYTPAQPAVAVPAGVAEPAPAVRGLPAMSVVEPRKEDPLAAQLNALQNEMAQLRATMQAGNLVAAGFQEPQTASVDDILATIIAPPGAQNGGNT